MNKFLYVFGEKERDALLLLGYNLLKSDTDSNTYIFEDRNNFFFDKNTIKAASSDVLTF